MNPVRLTDVRRQLTEIVDAARDRNIATALTDYQRPRAFVVSVPFFEQASRDAELARLLWERNPELFDELMRDVPDVSVPLKMAAD